jgi:conjugative transfer pilus assembly protein TraH
MKITKIIILFFSALITTRLGFNPSSANAGLQEELDRLADSLGAMSTTSAPGVYEGQTRGYITGGSLSLRFPQDNLNFASIRLPKVRAGCEGIDFDLGAFSYINRDQLVNKLRLIGSSSLGYAAMIGLESVSPQIAGTIKYWESELNKRLNSNITTCQAARALVDGGLGLVERVRSSQINRCSGARTAAGASSDYDAARTECVNDPASAATVGDDEDREMGQPDRNYLWYALNGLISLDEEQRELILSVVGTVITANGQTFPLRPTLSIETLMIGGSIERWDCVSSDPNCLAPVLVTDASTIGMNELVRQRMSDLLASVRNKSVLSPADVAFVSTAPVPLYRMMNALSTMSPAVAQSYIAQWSEPIALVMVEHWIRQAADYARDSLATAKIETHMAKQLEQMISTAERRVQSRAEGIRFTIATFDSQVQTLERLERAISQNLIRTGLVGTYDFGKANAGK